MVNPNDEAGLQRAASMIRKSMSRRPRLDELAAAAGLSPFHFHRRFKKRFGETPGRMSARLRMDHAKELIRQGVPLDEVARRSGFTHQSHFSAAFKAATGTSPARWRRDQRT